MAALVATLALSFAPHASLPPTRAIAALSLPPVGMSNLPRSRNLNRQAFNRRNMSREEREAYDEIMRERQGATTVGTAVAAAVLIGAGFVLSDPSRCESVLPAACGVLG